jgi:F-type H+-transporting ATPase subunit b
MIEAFLAAEEKTNPLLPASYDIIWGTVCFVLLLWLFGRFVLPAFTRVTAERAEKIEGGFERAKQMQAEAAHSRDTYAARLEDAAKEAAAIRVAAQGEGEQIVAEARTRATAEAAAIAARAEAQIRAEREAAVGALRRDVGDLALQLAGRIVEETLQDDARARAAIDRFISELEASAATTEPGTR